MMKSLMSKGVPSSAKQYRIPCFGEVVMDRPVRLAPCGGSGSEGASVGAAVVSVVVVSVVVTAGSVVVSGSVVVVSGSVVSVSVVVAVVVVVVVVVVVEVVSAVDSVRGWSSTGADAPL